MVTILGSTIPLYLHTSSQIQAIHDEITTQERKGRMTNYWTKNAGLDIHDFINLDKKTKKKLIRLLACVMESAYRRAVQQTLTLNNEDRIDEWIRNKPEDYRYEKSLSKSIGLDGFTTNSIDRLNMEHNLSSLGLFLENDSQK